MTRLGCQLQIVTKYTAMVAVDAAAVRAGAPRPTLEASANSGAVAPTPVKGSLTIYGSVGQRGCLS